MERSILDVPLRARIPYAEIRTYRVVDAIKRITLLTWNWSSILSEHLTTDEPKKVYLLQMGLEHKRE